MAPPQFPQVPNVGMAGSFANQPYQQALDQYQQGVVNWLQPVQPMAPPSIPAPSGFPGQPVGGYVPPTYGPGGPWGVPQAGSPAGVAGAMGGVQHAFDQYMNMPSPQDVYGAYRFNMPGLTADQSILGNPAFGATPGAVTDYVTGNVTSSLQNSLQDLLNQAAAMGQAPYSNFFDIAENAAGAFGVANPWESVGNFATEMVQQGIANQAQQLQEQAQQAAQNAGSLFGNLFGGGSAPPAGTPGTPMASQPPPPPPFPTNIPPSVPVPSPPPPPFPTNIQPQPQPPPPPPVPTNIPPQPPPPPVPTNIQPSPPPPPQPPPPPFPTNIPPQPPPPPVPTNIPGTGLTNEFGSLDQGGMGYWSPEAGPMPPVQASDFVPQPAAQQPAAPPQQPSVFDPQPPPPPLPPAAPPAPPPPPETDPPEGARPEWDEYVKEAERISDEAVKAYEEYQKKLKASARKRGR